MATNFRNRRGGSHDGKDESNCSTIANDGGEADGGIDEGKEDAVTASNVNDRGNIDTRRQRSLSNNETYYPGDFFIDDFNCGRYGDVETQLANDSLCVDRFEHNDVSIKSRSNISVPGEKNTDVAYERKVSQDQSAGPFFNTGKAHPPRPKMMYIVMSISVFAIFGCLARIYTDILFHERLGVTTTGKRERKVYGIPFCHVKLKPF